MDGINTDIILKSNISKEYIAGYFDGEGCVRMCLSKTGSGGIHVFITNTYKPFLIYLKDVYGGNTSLRTPENERHKQCYQWRLSNKKDALIFLNDILPFLNEKKEQAELAIKYCLMPDLKINRFTIDDKDKLFIKKEIKDIADKLKFLKHERHYK